MKEEEEAGHKMVEAQRKLVDAEEQQRARVAAELAAPEAKDLSHGSDLAALNSQRDQLRSDKKELLKQEEKKQLKALAKRKAEVEEGVRAEKERTAVLAGLQKAKEARDKSAEQLEQQVSELAQALGEVQSSETLNPTS